MTDRYSEPDDEELEPEELEDDSHLSRLTPTARHHLAEARAALERPERSGRAG